MQIRLIDIVSVRDITQPFDAGDHRQIQLASQVSIGRRIFVQIDMPLNAPEQFDFSESFVVALIPVDSLPDDIKAKLKEKK